jgi:hypothetical protein
MKNALIVLIVILLLVFVLPAYVLERTHNRYRSKMYGYARMCAHIAKNFAVDQENYPTSYISCDSKDEFPRGLGRFALKKITPNGDVEFMSSQISFKGEIAIAHIVSAEGITYLWDGDKNCRVSLRSLSGMVPHRQGPNRPA